MPDPLHMAASSGEREAACTAVSTPQPGHGATGGNPSPSMLLDLKPRALNQRPGQAVEAEHEAVRL